MNARYSSRQRWGFLSVLLPVSTSNYFDRNVISVLLEPIRQEFHVSDTLLGLLGGFCFAIFYAVFGIPVARWADRGNRRTIITLALAVRSVMTMLCGLAQTFWQLALARIGVGAGESGAIPPSQSLIVDYFPPERRATALAIFTSASTAGYLLAFGVGGYLAATYGWRTAFLLAGAPGLVLAVIVRLTLVEPRLLRQRGDTAEAPESLGQTLAMLRRKPSYLYALTGCLLCFFVAYGSLIFIPSFLMRVLHIPLIEVSTKYGIVGAAASVIGALAGGTLADVLGKRDVRWLAWLPAIACVLAGPFYVLALASHDFVAFLAFVFMAGVLTTGGLPPVFAAIHAVCGSRRRAMAIGIVLFSATLFGGGFGPLITGVLSDALSTSHGPEGLRYSLMATMTVLMVTGVVFFAFGRAMPRDLEE